MTVLPDDGLPLADEGLRLAADFPAATREEWQRLVEGVLRKSGRDLPGAAAEQALTTPVDDGLVVRPLYTAQDATGNPAQGSDPGYPGFPPYVRGGKPVAGWDVRQRHTLPDPEAANEAVLADLENGVTSIWLAAGGSGVPVAGLERALAGVYLDLAPVVLDAGPETGAAARELLRLYEVRGVAEDAARGNLGADPLGYAARSGASPRAYWDEAAELAQRCRAGYPGLIALPVPPRLAAPRDCGSRHPRNAPSDKSSAGPAQTITPAPRPSTASTEELAQRTDDKANRDSANATHPPAGVRGPREDPWSSGLR